MIGMAEAVAGDYRWYENTLEAFSKVTLDDIERVRRQYLNKDNRVVGLYEPNDDENG
jgi:predicted Zn-dependent peptidase